MQDPGLLIREAKKNHIKRDISNLLPNDSEITEQKNNQQKTDILVNEDYVCTDPA